MPKHSYRCGDVRHKALPWNKDKHFVFFVFLAMALASAAIASLLLSWGVSELRARGYSSIPSADFWNVLFGLCWLLCLVMNSTRLVRSKMWGIRLYDIVSGAVSPALLSAGIGYFACLLAYPLTAMIVGGLVLANSVSVFRDLSAVPLEGGMAQLMEFCAVTAGVLFLAFCLFSLDWGFGFRL